MITYADTIEVFNTLDDRPTAVNYGAGFCIASGVSYTSDGVAWVADGKFKDQVSPDTTLATATLTIAKLLKGIIYANTADAGVAFTLPLGTDTAAGVSWQMPNDSAFEWSIINAGTQTIEVIANTGHTFTGLKDIVTHTQGRFRTRKLTATTFATYRIA